MKDKPEPTIRGAIDAIESKKSAAGPGFANYWGSVWIEISDGVPSVLKEQIISGDQPTSKVQIKLVLDPRYKLGACYKGELSVGNTLAIIEAVAVCSAAGGRSWAAWDERLDDRIDSMRQGGLPNSIMLNGGDYLCIIHILEDH